MSHLLTSLCRGTNCLKLPLKMKGECAWRWMLPGEGQHFLVSILALTQRQVVWGSLGIVSGRLKMTSPVEGHDALQSPNLSENTVMKYFRACLCAQCRSYLTLKKLKTSLTSNLMNTKCLRIALSGIGSDTRRKASLPFSPEAHHLF